jgi:NTP pyrophosphatase (non-canonical NTP hydrolase)
MPGTDERDDLRTRNFVMQAYEQILGKPSTVDKYKPKMTFATLQRENNEWANRNFGPGNGDNRAIHSFLGVVEEAGELAHALLKQYQGIRGTYKEHEEAAKDAVGDLVIYLADLCSRKGWSFQDIVEETWAQVKMRDWVQNKGTGVAQTSSGTSSES